MIKVGIIGGTGYTGSELLRLLAHHPEAEIIAITSRTEAGKAVAGLFPSLRRHVDLVFTDPADQEALALCDVVFSATPNGVAATQAPALLKRGVRLIDIAADFRLKDVACWEHWYGMTHPSPELIAEAVYGLPEMNRDRIRDARLVANPGCYPTAIQLGFLPAVEAGLVAPESLVASAVSGVSGAGRAAHVPMLFAEVAESVRAYNVSGHRHRPEIAQGLSAVAGQPMDLVFIPHIAPLIRGMQATLTMRLLRTDLDVQALYEERYRHEPFVDVLPGGSHPDTRMVRGTNMCHIAIHRPMPDRLVVLTAIDNLSKGASGQAVQNFNLMCGFDEKLGLSEMALFP